MPSVSILHVASCSIVLKHQLGTELGFQYLDDTLFGGIECPIITLINYEWNKQSLDDFVFPRNNCSKCEQHTTTQTLYYVIIRHIARGQQLIFKMPFMFFCSAINCTGQLASSLSYAIHHSPHSHQFHMVLTNLFLLLLAPESGLSSTETPFISLKCSMMNHT